MNPTEQDIPVYGAVNYDPWGTPRIGDWIQTYTGKKFYLLDPKPADFDIHDIAGALSNICRFTGHTSHRHWFWGKRTAFYSVAQHCCHVYDELKRKYPMFDCQYYPASDRVSGMAEDEFSGQQICYAGLMHDAAEAYICDMARPFKQLPEFKFYREIEHKLEYQLFGAMRVRNPLPAVVKTIDEILLGTEARDLMDCPIDGWHFRYTHLAKKIKPWSPHKAEREFMERYWECNPFGATKPSSWRFLDVAKEIRRATQEFAASDASGSPFVRPGF